MGEIWHFTILSWFMRAPLSQFPKRVANSCTDKNRWTTRNRAFEIFWRLGVCGLCSKLLLFVFNNEIVYVTYKYACYTYIYIYVYIKNTYYYLLYTWKTRVPWLEPFGMLAAECIPNSEISAFCGFFIAPAKSQCPCKKKTSAVKSHPLRGNDSRSQDVLTVIGSHRFPWLPKKTTRKTKQ